MYLVKANATGGTQWSRTFGGGNTDDAYSVQQTSDGGYILAGYTMSFPNGDPNMYLVRTNANGDTLWTHTYGGGNNDVATFVEQTSDGGFIMAGRGDTFGAGSHDMYLVKTDANGGQQWFQTFGGGSAEEAYAVHQTSDGGYILAGYTFSFGAGSQVYLVKTDEGGNYQWSRTVGGGDTEEARSVQQTDDGGYILAGYTNSFPVGDANLYMVRTNATGDTLWTRVYGGPGNDIAVFVEQTVDGGFILTGRGNSFGAGNHDMYLLKTDASGIQQWLETFGGGSEDEAHAASQTPDRGYVVVGHTYSFGTGGRDMWLVKTGPEIVPEVPQMPPGTLWSRTYGGGNNETADQVWETADHGYILTGMSSSFTAGSDDFWTLRTDTDGDSVWNRHYGGPAGEWCRSSALTSDGGLVLAGSTQSFGAGGKDFWIVRTNGVGDSLWSRTCGGAGDDEAGAVIQSADGEFALGGITQSFGAGNNDFWLVKISSNGDSLWSRTFGSGNNDDLQDLKQTVDGGYVLVGSTLSGSWDVMLVRTDNTGSELWTRTYGGSGADQASQVLQTADGGFLIAGHTLSYGPGGARNYWLVKTDANGDTLWTRPIGGSAEEACWSLQPDLYGGYLLAGNTGPGGGSNIWLVRVSADGDSLWSQTFGGGNEDECYAVQHVSDGGYVLAGFTTSYGSGGRDFWLIKTQAEESPFRLQWIDPAGGSWFDWDNWNPARIPEATDTVFITLPGDYTVTVPTYADVSQLVLGSGIPGDTTTQTLSVNCASCQLAIYGNSVVRETGVLSASSGATVALAGASISLTDSGQVALAGSASLNLGATNMLDITNGLLELADNTDLTNGGSVQNAGTVLRHGAGSSALSGNYREVGLIADSSLTVAGGMLEINAPDSAVVRSIVSIAAGAELVVQRAQVRDFAAIGGDGSLTLAAGNADIAGDVALTGTLNISGGSVNFHPPSAAALDTFRIGSSASFTSAVGMNVAVVAMNGGTTTADFNISSRYDWTAGILAGANGSNVTINSGVNLYLTGPGSKTLDTRNFVIDGTAAMSGAGTFTLANGADIVVGAGGTLALGDSLTISGSADTLFNHGATTVSAPTDTCVLNLFVLNDPSGRTPGTIDVLSGRCRCQQIRNNGSVIIRELTQIWITQTFTNSSLADLRNGSVWIAADSLINLSTGIIYLVGDAAISGNGVLQNEGSIYRQGGALRTPSTCNITTEFHNLAGGFVAIEVDTLALTNPVADNADTILIYTGAALNAGTTFTNLPGGVVIGGGQFNITINNLVMQIIGRSVLLSWTSIPGAASYDVYRATEPYDNILQYSYIGNTIDPAYFHFNQATLPRAFYRVIPR